MLKIIDQAKEITPNRNKRGMNAPKIFSQIHIPKGYAEHVSDLIAKDRPNLDLKKDWVVHEYVLFFTSLIFVEQLQIFRKKENWYVPLSNEKIRDYFHHGEVIFTWLEKHDILESTGYQRDVTPIKYRFKKAHRFQPYSIRYPTLVRKLEERRIIRQSAINSDPILSKIFERTDGVILEEGAEQWIENSKMTLRKKAYALRSITAIRERDLSKGFFMTIGGKGGRIFSSFSNLMKDLRKFLRIDGETVCDKLDIKCSQFQILYILFRDKYDNHEDAESRDSFKSEMARYASHFQGGRNLYDFVGEKLNWKRKKVKKRIISWLFENNVRNLELHYPEIHEFFKEQFPKLLDLIIDFKKEKSLAAALQGFESQVIIEDMAIRQIYPKGISFITVHDSILVGENQLSWVLEQVWDPTLAKYGFPETLNNERSLIEEPQIDISEKEIGILKLAG